MTSTTLLQITQHIRHLPRTVEAAQALVDWVTIHICPAYLMLFDQLLTADAIDRNPDFVRWLSERHHWRDMHQPEQTSEALFVPIIYGGRTQGLLALETGDDSAFQVLPLAELLAMRLDSEYTAKMTYRARALAEEMNRVNSVADVLQHCVEGILPVFNASAAVIFKFEPEDKYGEALAEHPSQMTVGRDMGLDDYVAFQHIFASGDVIIFDENRGHAVTTAMKTAMRTVGIEQVIAAPLLTAGRLIGALVLGLNVPEDVRRFTGREREMLRLLAYTLATAYVYTRRLTSPPRMKLDNKMFRQLVDKANVAIDIHTPEGEIIYHNEEWSRLFRADEHNQHTFTQRFQDNDKPMLDNLIYPNAALQQGWRNTITLVREDEHPFDANVSVVALRDTQDKIMGYSTITTDITDLHRVMDSLQQQTTRLAAAASVSQAIITTQDMNELTENVLRLICNQFHYDFAHILLINDERDQLKVTMACDLRGEIVQSLIGYTLPLNAKSTAQWVISNGHPLLIKNVEEDDRHVQHAKFPLIASELVLLLQAANEILGVLIVQSKQTDAFSYDDTDVMQSISDQLAIAIHNANLFGQLRERLADMNAMGEVSLLVQAAFDLDALMNRIYDAMRRVHPQGDFTFALYHPEQHYIDLTTFTDGRSQTTRQPTGDDLISQMLAQAAPIFWRTDDERAATAAYFNLPPAELPNSFIGLPLIAKDSVLGALFTHSETAATFDENDLQFMLTLVNSAAFAIENMRLLADTKQRVHEMEILHSISQTLSETFGMVDMWDRLLSELADLFPQGLVTVVLYDPLFNTLQMPAVDGTKRLVPAPPEPLARAVVNNSFTLNFQDLMHADERLEGLDIDPYQLNLGAVRSWVGTPLRSRDNETVGVIALQSNVAESFVERDVSLLNTVAAQISLALDNVRLLNAEQERREVANSLIDMGRLVTSSLNIDDVFERIFEQVKRLLPYRRAAILIPSDPDDSRQMTVHAVDGFDASLAGAELVIHEQSPCARVLSSREPVTITHIAQAVNWHYQPDILQQGAVESWMGVPLVVQSEVIGLLTIDNDQLLYSTDDAPPIFALARQAAIAVDNARLHTQAEENLVSLKTRAERLASMHHLATYVSSSLDQDQILDHATHLLTDLFKVPYACVILIDAMDGNGYLVAEHPREYIGKVSVIKGTPAFDAFQDIVHHNDAVHMPNTPENQDSLLLTEFEGGYVIAPLLAYERVLGCVVLGINQPDRVFDEENLETFMTITAQLAIAIRNAELFQDALEASRLKNEFLATVSHELRTPLNAIIGYSELLLSGTYGDMEERQQDRMERVYRSGRQLLAIINDILDLSKIEAGKMDLQLTNLAIDTLLQDALATVSPQADAKALSVHVELPDNLPAIYADSNRMRQVMVNLLSNAVKFTKEGHVTVSAQITDVSIREFPELLAHMVAHNNQWIQISVSDTGIGIAPKDQNLIFEVFTQADGSSIREYEGTGLGLAITRRLVQLHKGHIWVESEEGVGSTFHVLVPTLETAQRSKYAVDDDDERPIIMIADEDELTLQLISEYLDKRHYQIISVRETDDLWSLLNDIIPDAIVTDLMMPNMEGLDMLHQLKAHDALTDVPIIVCTILEREEDVLALGAQAYIKKPVMRNQLLAVLATALTS